MGEVTRLVFEIRLHKSTCQLRYPPLRNIIFTSLPLLPGVTVGKLGEAYLTELGRRGVVHSIAEVHDPGRANALLTSIATLSRPGRPKLSTVLGPTVAPDQGAAHVTTELWNRNPHGPRGLRWVAKKGSEQPPWKRLPTTMTVRSTCGASARHTSSREVVAEHLEEGLVSDDQISPQRVKSETISKWNEGIDTVWKKTTHTYTTTNSSCQCQLVVKAMQQACPSSTLQLQGTTHVINLLCPYHCCLIKSKGPHADGTLSVAW
jgi:hypothetical protein